MMRLIIIAGSPQVGAKIANSPSQALSQEGSQSGSVDIADFGGDGVDIEAAAVKERLRPFDAQILEVGERRFAEDCPAAPLQRARARRQRLGGRLQRKAVLEMFPCPS